MCERLGKELLKVDLSFYDEKNEVFIEKSLLRLDQYQGH